MIRAATYLRSSKDRSDISIDSQRRELRALASERGYLITAELTDVVESAKSEHRPGFQQLIRELKAPNRAWDALLVTDTSRLSRRVYVAYAFKHECEKRGVKIVYSKLPEMDPITRVVLESVFQAMDEVHSLMSREKGLAGMAENVKQGYRAGGRAPKGYRLRRIETGAIRDGSAVTKSVLEPSEDAPAVRRYLEARAIGTPRLKAARAAGLAMSPTSLVGLDWNALTYAGATVWNVHNEKNPEGGYKGGTKRRGRDEWVIQWETHPPLIGREEAEAILHQMETSEISQTMKAAKTADTPYLLSGLLVTPEGDPWYGNARKHYRTQRKGKRNRWVPLADLEESVTKQVMADMQSDRFAKALAREAKQAKEAAAQDPAKDLRAEVVGLNAQIQKAMDLAMRLEDPAPALRTVDGLEKRRKGLAEEIARLEREHTARLSVAGVTEAQVKELLAGIAADLADRGQLKALIGSFVERIVLDPDDLTCSIHYRFQVQHREQMASPRGFADYPVMAIIRRLRVA
jgi:site-specific DNA recombinase